MIRTEFIDMMKAQVKEMKAQQKEEGKRALTYENYRNYNKLGREISAIENAIREMERK